jgi:hypothetical protein
MGVIFLLQKYRPISKVWLYQLCLQSKLIPIQMIPMVTNYISNPLTELTQISTNVIVN